MILAAVKSIIYIANLYSKDYITLLETHNDIYLFTKFSHDRFYFTS